MYLSSLMSTLKILNELLIKLIKLKISRSLYGNCIEIIVLSR